MLTALTPVSHTVRHRFASTSSTLCSSSAKSPSLSRPLLSLWYTPHPDSPWHDCSSRCPLVLYGACCISRIFSSSTGSVWHTGSLDIRGFTGDHSTRCCCPLLQYLQFLRRWFLILTHAIHSCHAYHFSSCDTSDVNYIYFVLQF